ncbi:MAG: hypothetical protein QXW10_01985 [Candidatus Micrarchaeaceae archaeon]
MKYAREHIKRYWVFEYRRALGVSMVTFAIALSIGVVFTTLIGNLATPNATYELIFWGLLILFTAMVLVSSFVNAHILSIKYMTESEFKVHSKYMGGWLTILTIGVIAFALPLLFFTNIYEPIAILFGFGGVFWVMFLSVKMLFNYPYYEIAIGASALWIIAFIALFGIISAPQSVAAVAIGSFSLFISVLSLIIITGFIGISLLVNASNEFSHEFRHIADGFEHGTLGAQKKRLHSGSKKSR